MFNKQAKRRLQLVIPVLMTVAMAHAQNFVVDWHTIDGGGATASTGGNWELSGTIGQPDAGTMTGGNWEVAGGFWPGMTFIPSADFDGDGDVDSVDHASYDLCDTGPGQTTNPLCDATDADRDGDTDLGDWAVLQHDFTGTP